MSNDVPLSDIMDVAATGFERALVDSVNAPLLGLDAEVIDQVWQPLSCSPSMLGLLAYQYGVNLLEESWTLDTKRRWIDNNWNFLAKRGTITAVRMALGASGYNLVEYFKPPAGFYASPEMTKKEMDEWVHLMPELRITFARREGSDFGQWFAEEDFAEDAFAGLDDGSQLYGYFAFLRQDGVVTPLDTITEVKSLEKQTVRDVERYAMPGLSTVGFFADESAADDEQYNDAEEKPAFVTTMVLDKRYVHEASELELTTITPSLEPIDTRFEIDSDIGFWGYQTFSADAVADEDFAGEDDAGEMLARRVFLLDPTVQVPKTKGASFADYDRIGFEPKTIEMMVDLGLKDENEEGAFADEFACDINVADVEDTSDIDRAIRAIEAARGHTDKVLVTFETLRPLLAGDVTNEATRVGDWVPNSL